MSALGSKPRKMISSQSPLSARLFLFGGLSNNIHIIAKLMRTPTHNIDSGRIQLKRFSNAEFTVGCPWANRESTGKKVESLDIIVSNLMTIETRGSESKMNP